MRSLDAGSIAKSIGETMGRAACPLSDDQLMVMIGALHIWLEKVREEERYGKSMERYQNSRTTPL